MQRYLGDVLHHGHPRQFLLNGAKRVDAATKLDASGAMLNCSVNTCLHRSWQACCHAKPAVVEYVHGYFEATTFRWTTDIATNPFIMTRIQLIHCSVFWYECSLAEFRRSNFSLPACHCLQQLGYSVPSVLWRCWLGSRKGIWPVRNWVAGRWHGCLGQGADLYMAQLMRLPLTISCSSK